MLWLLIAVFGALMPHQAAASAIVFQGQNAGLFSGANPNDTANLLSAIPRPSAPTPTTPTLDTAQLIQQSVASQISSRVYSQIFNSPSGNTDLGNGSRISWFTSGGNVSITFTTTTGSTTITVPAT